MSFKIQCLKTGKGFDQQQIEKIFSDVEKTQFLKDDPSMIDITPCCIDGRETNPIFGCFGGAACEWLLALRSYELINQLSISYDQQLSMLRALIIARKNFYFHSDERCIIQILNDCQIYQPHETLERQFITPTMENRYKLFNLICEYQPKHIGCGHLMLSYTRSTEYQTNQVMIQHFLKIFFTLLWYEKIEGCNFIIVYGRHQEKAVCIVEEPDYKKENNQIFKVRPALQADQTFVYHPFIQTVYRKMIVSFIQKELGFTNEEDAILDRINEVGIIQTKLTLEVLAYDIPTYKIKYE